MRIKIVSIPVTMEVPELDKYEIEEIRTALSQTKEEDLDGVLWEEDPGFPTDAVSWEKCSRRSARVMDVCLLLDLGLKAAFEFKGEVVAVPEIKVGINWLFRRISAGIINPIFVTYCLKTTCETSEQPSQHAARP